MSFEIFTDTSANLTASLAAAHGIHVIPFSYYIDGVEHICEDIEAFDGEAYYSSMKHGVMPKTSQISPARYIEYMEPTLADGRDVLYVGMSSGVSGSFASSRLAAAHLAEKYPERKIVRLDTLAASLGEGLQVLHAVRLRDKGATIEMAERELTAARARMYQVFTVGDLMHLKRNGRLSGIGALLGSALAIKPLLKGDENGKIINFDTARGRRRAIRALAAKYEELAVRPGHQTIGIAHAGCPEDAETLAVLLRESATPPADIMTVCYEPVTGAHVGPATLALFFEGGEGVRSK